QELRRVAAAIGRDGAVGDRGHGRAARGDGAVVLDERVGRRPAWAHALEGRRLDDAIPQRQSVQAKRSERIGHRRGSHGARARMRSMNVCGVSVAASAMARVTRPGAHSASPANIARTPASATASGDIITPSRRARRTLTPVESYNAVAVAPGRRQVTLTP